LLRTKPVVYCTVDPFLSSRGKFLYGFDQFQSELDEREIPCVWISSQSRLQLDDPRRRVSHGEPFIAEDGCAVYLPEDYFHLKPARTVRMGRFTCLPAAKEQPAAKDALESLTEESGVTVVPLRSLSPRELSQNTGLPGHEAELTRQRDFDELFFFAGASDDDLARFKSLAQEKKFALRQHGAFWSIALGPDVRRCIRDVGDLYDRSLHSHANRFAIAVAGDAEAVLPACDRGVRVVASTKSVASESQSTGRVLEIAITAPDLWESTLAAIDARA